MSRIHCAKFKVYTCSIYNIVTIPINACSSFFNYVKCCYLSRGPLSSEWSNTLFFIDDYDEIHHAKNVQNISEPECKFFKRLHCQIQVFIRRIPKYGVWLWPNGHSGTKSRNWLWNYLYHKSCSFSCGIKKWMHKICVETNHNIGVLFVIHVAGVISSALFNDVAWLRKCMRNYWWSKKMFKSFS